MTAAKKLEDSQSQGDRALAPRQISREIELLHQEIDAALVNYALPMLAKRLINLGRVARQMAGFLVPTPRTLNIRIHRDDLDVTMHLSGKGGREATVYLGEDGSFEAVRSEGDEVLDEVKYSSANAYSLAHWLNGVQGS